MRAAMAVAAVTMGLSCVAMGNGINPPRPREAVITTATCTPRAGGRDVEVLRASLVGGEKDGALIGSFDGLRTSFQIGSASSIEVPENNVDLEGAVSGRVAFKVGEVREGKLVVRGKEGNVRLVGFDAMGSRIEMDLVACRKVAFSATAVPEPSRIDVPGKQQPVRGM